MVRVLPGFGTCPALVAGWPISPAKGREYFYEAGRRLQSFAVHRFLPGPDATVQAQRRWIDYRLVELLEWQGAGRRGGTRLFVDGLAGREHSARTRGDRAGLWRAAVQVQPGVPARGEHGSVLSGVL